MTVLPEETMTEAGEEDARVAFGKRRCMSFCMPCFPAETESPCWWEDVSLPAKKERWWYRQWKSFIRRFAGNKNKKRQCSFRYDPLSYALNFDDGAAAADDDYGYKCFSARFVSLPLTDISAAAADSSEEHVQTLSKFEK